MIRHYIEGVLFSVAANCAPGLLTLAGQARYCVYMDWVFFQYLFSLVSTAFSLLENAD
jgi:hypothetical protein